MTTQTSERKEYIARKTTEQLIEWLECRQNLSYDEREHVRHIVATLKDRREHNFKCLSCGGSNYAETV